LSWTAGTGGTSGDVYFGTDPTPDAGEFKGNQVGTMYNPGILTPSTVYYWRIDEKNSCGTTTGNVWSFTTEPESTGQDPTAPINNDEPAEDGDPVRLHNGEHDLRARDLSIMGRIMPVVIQRRYRGQPSPGSREDSPFGYGWDMSYNVKVGVAYDENDDIDYLALYDGRNRLLIYSEDGTHGGQPKYSPAAGAYDFIVINADDTYTLHKKHGTKLDFDTEGKLTKITDRNNNNVSFTYNGSDQLTKITDDLGREIDLYYNGSGQLADVNDFAGRNWSYSYDANDDLTSVTGPNTPEWPSGLTTTYTYDVNHNMTSVTDANSQTWLVNRYDSSDRVDEQTFGGADFVFDYNTDSNETTVTDRNGYDSNTIHNNSGSVLSRTVYTEALRAGDPASYTTSYVYDVNDEMIRKTLPGGSCVEYTYDVNGNMTGMYRKVSAGDPNDPCDADVIGVVYTYQDKFNLVKTVKDPRGNVTTFDYDPNGNLTKTTYPTVKTDQGNKTPTIIFKYDAKGRITEANSTDGILTKSEYYDEGDNTDPNCGKLYKVTVDYNAVNSTNITTSYAYDIYGNVIEVNDPYDKKTYFVYNKLNQLTKITDPCNYVTLFSYNDVKMLSQSEREVTGDSNQVTSFTYTLLDKLKEVTDPLTYVTKFEYDDSDNTADVNDAEDNNTGYVYDERDLLWKVTDANGNITEFGYTANGLLADVNDAKGNATTFDYDSFDRLIRINYPDDSNEEFGYDKSSNLTSYKNRNGETINYEYDALNRMTVKNRPDDPNIYFTYDIAGRVVEVNDLRSVSEGGGITSFYYWQDRFGTRVTEVNDIESRVVKYVYDKLGRRTSLNYPNWGPIITYEYDEISRLRQVELLGGNWVEYEYDELSRRTKSTVLNDANAVYEYDLNNRLLKVTNNIDDGNTIIFDYNDYDKVGNRRRMKKDSANAHVYTYDELYRLTNVDYNDGNTTSYVYDGLGNRTEVNESSTANGYSSNNLNQYTSIITYANIAHWRLDDNADSTAVVDSSGNGRHGTASENTSVLHTDTCIAGTGAFKFDGNDDYVNIGNNVKPSLPISVSMWIEPNSLGGNQWLFENDKYTATNYYGVWSYIKNNGWLECSYGDGGSPGPSSRRTKVSASTVSLSEWQHVAFVIEGATDMDIYIDGTDVGGTYSGTGGTMAYSSGNGSLGCHAGSNYFFDGRIDEVMVFDKALSAGEIRALYYCCRLDYDKNGNMTVGPNGWRYYYDCENRLTDVNDYDDDPVVSCKYDYLGRRVKKIVHGNPNATTKYCYDGDQVIQEYGSSDNHKRTFVYGAGIDEPVYLGDVAAGTNCYHYDGLGNVVALSHYDLYTSDNGKIKETYKYDVFGRVTIFDEHGSEISDSNIGNPYMFTGRRYDSETGLYYYRARYYNASIGRFLQPDPIGYAGGVNLYAYCGNNPLVWIDPSGLSKEGSTWGENWPLFWEWFFGDAPTHYYYGPESGRTQDLKGHVGTYLARYEFNMIPDISIYNADYPFRFDYHFGLRGLLESGLNPTAQYVGHYEVKMYPNPDGETKTVILENITNMKSFLYHITPESWNRDTGKWMGDNRQTYYWTEPLKTPGYTRWRLDLDLDEFWRMGP
jgi:RHS repeat-associated protein